MKLPLSVDKDNENTFYDFNKERFLLWIVGGFTIVKSDSPYFILNVLGIVCIGSLYAYGLIAGCYTVIFVAKDKSMMVQSGYAVGLMCVSIGLRICKILTNDSLKHTTELLRNGIFTYNETFQEEYKKIKIKRIKDLKFLVSFISNGLFFCAFNLGVVIPVMDVLLGGGTEDEENGLNPYLPLHIFVPFNTRNALGYSLAYAANVLTMATMYTSFVCHEELYMCTTLQLTTELEVLSRSLGSIEERAYLRFKESGRKEGRQDSLYDLEEYQNCIYLCLRENIRHHHAILRFRDAMRPYAEASNTFCVLLISVLIAAAMVIMLQTSRPQIPSITDIFGFLPMCWVGQLLVNESSKTMDALFGTPWPFCCEKYKSLLKVFMANTQKPLVVKAKIVNMNIYLETFAEMISLGYKIINVLR